MSLDLPYNRRGLATPHGTQSEEVTRQLHELSLNNRNLYTRPTAGDGKAFMESAVAPRELRPSRELRKEPLQDPRAGSRETRDVRADYKGPTREMTSMGGKTDAFKEAPRCLHKEEANRLLQTLEQYGGFHEHLIQHPDGEKGLRVLHEDGRTLALLNKKHVDRMLKDAIHGCDPIDTARQCRNCATQFA